jgi:uroporphyrinogen-III synthase
MKSVLLTRSELLNTELRESLKNYKYELLECSLLTYKLQPFDFLEFYKFQNVVVTSIFVACELPKAQARGMDAWVVGIKSAKILKDKGYRIKFVALDAENLKRKIPKGIYYNTIYPSSDHISVKMPVHITRKIFYKVLYRESLSNEQLLRYKQGIDYVLLYSENCAKILVKLLLQNDLINSLKNATYISISSKVDKVIRNHFQKTEILQGTDLILEYLKNNDQNKQSG